MPKPLIRYGEDDVDWEPLQSVVGTEELGKWMWMHSSPCSENGADVNFYKHRWSRRYLRLDGEGRVYKELFDGTPLPLPHCGGALLVVVRGPQYMVQRL